MTVRSERPEFLYKYVPYPRLSILEDGFIRFTQPGDFNDPFELSPSFDLMSRADIASLPLAPDQGDGTGPKQRLLTNEWLNRMLTAAARRTHANAPPGATFSIPNNDIARDILERRWGILSLTSSPENLLMWAHYADCHRGFVIQFDGRHSFFSSGVIEPVEYSIERPIASLSSLDDPSIFFRKSLEWAYEVEWRCVRPLNQAAKIVGDDRRYPIHLFRVPFDAITRVVTGAFFPLEHQRALEAVCSKPHLAHVRICHANLNREHFALDISPRPDGLPDSAAVAGRALSARRLTTTRIRGPVASCRARRKAGSTNNSVRAVGDVAGNPSIPLAL